MQPLRALIHRRRELRLMRPTKSVRTVCSNNWIPNCPRTDADAASAGPWAPWAKVTLRIKHFPNQALQARLFLWHGCPGHGCHPADGNAMQTHKVVPICNERWVYEIDAFRSAHMYFCAMQTQRVVHSGNERRCKETDAFGSVYTHFCAIVCGKPM